jgi:hypothetical protein
MRVDVDLSQSDLMYREEASAPRVAHAAYSLLDECGFDVTDFVIEEETQSDLARLLGLAGGVMRIRCQSTGEDRVYSTGLGSAWMASVLGDLDDGHFRHAFLRAGDAGVARRNAALARRAGVSQQSDFSDTAPDIRLPEFDAGYLWNAGRRADAFVASGLGAF